MCAEFSMNKLTTLNLSSSNMKFAAAHFTIFSATERENLHGHNFVVSARITSFLQDTGLMFDYQVFKKTLADMCALLDEKLLIPASSPYLNIINSEEEIIIKFANETLRFLPRDVLLLPIANISVENLAYYFLSLMLEKKDLLEKNQVESLMINVASSPSQSGEAYWNL
jgi:6-pyruvoyltetrahydropterin/6-carboxytetrahydropterin synthase